jgi:peptide/nickel transport system permease protein
MRTSTLVSSTESIGRAATPTATSTSQRDRPAVRTRYRRRWRLSFYVGLLAGAMLICLILMAVLADALAPYPPTVQTLAQRLQPPLTSNHPLGTDSLGRDVFSRLLYGSRVSLGVAATAVLIGGGIGICLGLVAGYFGGRLDSLIMRVGEVFLGFPLIIFAILFAAVFGPSFTVVAVILALGMWARFARLVRGETLSLKEREFVLAARMAGASDLWIMWRHILPHLLSSILILASLQAAWSIIIEASLSFFGAGVPPPAPSWGGMVNDGRDFLFTAWWLGVFPGLAIVMLVLSLNLFGDWARDYLDPRLRRTLS